MRYRWKPLVLVGSIWACGDNQPPEQDATPPDATIDRADREATPCGPEPHGCAGDEYCFHGACTQRCGVDRPPCAAGMCVPFVDLDSGLCIAECVPPHEACAATADNLDQACYLSAAGAACAPIGGGKNPGLPTGSLCSYFNHCTAGASCLSYRGRDHCLELCLVDQSTCPMGQTCVALVGELSLGACLPK